MATEEDFYSDYSEDFEEEDNSAVPSSKVLADTAAVAGGPTARELTTDAKEDSTPKKGIILAKLQPSTTSKSQKYTLLSTILVQYNYYLTSYNNYNFCIYIYNYIYIV